MDGTDHDEQFDHRGLPIIPHQTWRAKIETDDTAKCYRRFFVGRVSQVLSMTFFLYPPASLCCNNWKRTNGRRRVARTMTGSPMGVAWHNNKTRRISPTSPLGEGGATLWGRQTLLYIRFLRSWNEKCGNVKNNQLRRSEGFFRERYPARRLKGLNKRPGAHCSDHENGKLPTFH